VVAHLQSQRNHPFRHRETEVSVLEGTWDLTQGHEETPISASAHPSSPLVVSVSNLIIQHDLRMRKPINVNFITPPVYDIQYMADGMYYFLSGEPSRVARNGWVRTLLNGIGNVSDNCKYIAVNEMNGNLVLWDWRKSSRELVLSGVKNEEVYQSLYFKKEQGDITKLVFLEDDGYLLEHDILENRTSRRCILPTADQENWKMHVGPEATTEFVYTYEHEQCLVKCYQSFPSAQEPS
jgi:WD40 repeat protein